MTTRSQSGPAGGPAESLLPQVYNELRTLADHYLRNQARCPTLQPTALVHEAYVRLAKNGSFNSQDRGHFFAVASKAMRHILIDYVRRRGAIKRGADFQKFSLEEFDGAVEATGRAEYLLAVEDALNDLATVDPELGQMVEMRFFGGLNAEEIASAMGVSPVTVKRRWRLARSWLHREISKDA